jgi:hypothetical protein
MRNIVAAWLAACMLPLASPSATADIVIHVNKSTQRMLVLIDGTERYNWLVSTGARRYVTPNGDYHPYRFHTFWRSRKYGNAPMPHSIFFYEGYAVHGTVEARSLGRAASHGCVRLHPANAKTLFALVRKEPNERTHVVISDGPYVAPPPQLPEPLQPAPQPQQTPPSSADSVVADNATSPAESVGTLESSDLIEIAEADIGSGEANELADADSNNGTQVELTKAVTAAPEPALEAPIAPVALDEAPTVETKTVLAATSAGKLESAGEPAKLSPRKAKFAVARVAANSSAGFHW